MLRLIINTYGKNKSQLKRQDYLNMNLSLYNCCKGEEIVIKLWRRWKRWISLLILKVNINLSEMEGKYVLFPKIRVIIFPHSSSSYHFILFIYFPFKFTYAYLYIYSLTFISSLMCPWYKHILCIKYHYPMPLSVCEGQMYGTLSL